MIKFLLVLLFVSKVWAMPIGDQVIAYGPSAGERLIDIAKSYTAPGPDGELIPIPEKAIDDAFEFFDQYHHTNRTYQFMAVEPVQSNPHYSELKNLILQTNGPTIGNENYIVIFDLNQPRTAARLHIINIITGEINSIEASHGSESECKHKPLFACHFISDRDSDATPLGFFSTGISYRGERHPGTLITMNGLEQGSARRLPGGNIFPSTIVIHSAAYVKPGYAGRSHGCIAISLSNMNRFDDALAGGTLFYFYHSSLDNSSAEPQVSGLIE